MRTTNSHLHSKLRPIGPEASGFRVTPISGVKYGKYSYRLIFKPDSAKHDVEYICKSGFVDEFVYFKDALYIACYTDFLFSLIAFEKIIDQVSGPINEDHIDIILSKYECVIRPSNWYKLYDCKIEVYATGLKRINQPETTNEIVAMLEPPYKVVRNSHWSTSIYNNFESARLAEAMCNLTYPREVLRMYITRCLVYRE